MSTRALSAAVVTLVPVAAICALLARTAVAAPLLAEPTPVAVVSLDDQPGDILTLRPGRGQQSSAQSYRREESDGAVHWSAGVPVHIGEVEYPDGFQVQQWGQLRVGSFDPGANAVIAVFGMHGSANAYCSWRLSRAEQQLGTIVIRKNQVSVARIPLGRGFGERTITMDVADSNGDDESTPTCLAGGFRQVS